MFTKKKIKNEILNHTSLNLGGICAAILLVLSLSLSSAVVIAASPDKTCSVSWIRVSGSHPHRDFELRKMLHVTGSSYGDRLREVPLVGQTFEQICKHEGLGKCRNVWGWSGKKHSCDYVDGHGAVAVCCGPKTQNEKQTTKKPKDTSKPKIGGICHINDNGVKKTCNEPSTATCVKGTSCSCTVGMKKVFGRLRCS